jgi:hypothetical protein
VHSSQGAMKKWMLKVAPIQTDAVVRKKKAIA